MPRTTLDLDDAVLRELKRRRAREQRPLGSIASELIAQAIASEPPGPPTAVWESQPMGAKVDLEDAEAVWAVLDES